MTLLDLNQPAFIALKQDNKVTIHSMVVLQERQFMDEMIVLGWLDNGMGLFPRKHIYQTEQEAREAGDTDNALSLPEDGCGMPWFYFLASTSSKC